MEQNIPVYHICWVVAIEMIKVKGLLSKFVGSKLELLGSLPASIILILLCLVTSVISQIASNAATTSMLVPVVLTMATSLHINPLYLALGVTLTASHAFMLPVSTPCNAIIYTAAAEGLGIKHMLGVGVILNIVTMLTTLLCLHTYGGIMFDMDTFPIWANNTGLNSNIIC